MAPGPLRVPPTASRREEWPCRQGAVFGSHARPWHGSAPCLGFPTRHMEGGGTGLGGLTQELNYFGLERWCARHRPGCTHWIPRGVISIKRFDRI